MTTRQRRDAVALGAWERRGAGSDVRRRASRARAALSNQTVNLYAGPDESRTAPLWGVGGESRGGRFDKSKAPEI